MNATDSEPLDYLVIGGGPAGLQLGQLLQAAGHGYRILESGRAPGTFFRTFPRHRKLISINKIYNGTDDPELNLRMDWNSLLSPDDRMLFTRYSKRYFPHADDLVRYLADFAEAFKLDIIYDTRAERIRRHDAGFTVTDQHGQDHHARRLVMATGLTRPNTPDIPGIETAEGYSVVSVDPEDFTDRRVLIIGKGNSALETADNLVETAAVIHVAGPHSVRMAWNSHYVGHLRAVNNNFLDTYQLKSQNALLDGNVLSVEKDPGDGMYRVRFSFSRADEVVKELRYDRVIVCTGFRFDASVFDPECRPALVIDDRFAELSPAYESVNVPGLYFAGTLMQQRDFKKSTGGFIHGFRYAVRALSRILDERHHERPWPQQELESSPAVLADAVVTRVNRSSALWQQFGVIGDLIVTPTGEPARYHEEVPVAYAHESQLTASGDYFTVTLEYGPDHDKVDPFDITVRRTAQNSVDDAFDAAYLHPVIRHHGGGELLGVHHMAENLENHWESPEAHHAPLAEFFARELGRQPAPAGR
ncbi:Pyridine nucleotide-disulphide oxidoreductase [Streptomyces sp. 3213]|uniref:NAD(P)-binding domain-containing protein n=1 Tax=Streptomyces sp. 3213.3 TaxID=1855348 RepID=UPI000896A813|nr:NAD(P)-binding domain-containing protein [Streptomyces sp. 3213.3]SEC29534.1 Pyridine nucleotide-disulphide oxidoreductase [Streptomyces sp. 3213] [Streptomyces sp. 3213.3]